MIHRSRAIGLGWVLFGVLCAACGGSTAEDGGNDPKTCTHQGQTYQLGESFGSGCSTCQCTASGVECTAAACATPCEVNGYGPYQPGEQFSAGCVTCTCGQDGSASCTPTYCHDNGQQYLPGEFFIASDGCTPCICEEDGSVACGEVTNCVPTCIYGGDTHTAGETFPARDGCNECTCLKDGSVSCTELACQCSPANESWRSYLPADPEECTLIDYGCPENTVAFSNACGCGCEQDPSCPLMHSCYPPSQCYLDVECPYTYCSMF